MEDMLALAVCFVLGFGASLVFAALVYWVDRYEKEPFLLLGGVFLWGAVVAAGAAFVVNTTLGLGVYMFTGSEGLTNLTTGSFIAPVIEECLKGFAVLVVFFLFRHEFDSVMDGIVYAAVTALGFAATENVYYLYVLGYQDGGWGGLGWLFFLRILVFGWQHPFYTAFTGIALAVSRMTRNLAVKLFVPFVGLGIAIFTHSLHNTIAGIVPGLCGLAALVTVDWTGWLAMIVLVLIALFREQSRLAHYLKEEIGLGVITPAQYRVACSAWAQTGAVSLSAFGGNYRAARRFYRLTAELAHKKRQREVMGEEGGNTVIIERLRAELAALSPKVIA
ncbi:MAG: PrsW family intramembrane metalloprotease [Chloroflexota bacterium]